ncbi:hypothetical protein U9666_003938 [Escherichia coli]|nr:hypothetical protein [Escherichia coli]
MSNLRKYRESLNISQTTLAKAVGCTQGANGGGWFFNLDYDKEILAKALAHKAEESLRLQWRTFAADIMAVRLQKQ